MNKRDIKKYQLDQEEIEILEAFERGELKPVPNFEKHKQELIEAARAHMAKNKNINIRLSHDALYKLKEKAIEEGLPYQTLIGSILHKYITGKLRPV